MFDSMNEGVTGWRKFGPSRASDPEPTGVETGAGDMPLIVAKVNDRAIAKIHAVMLKGNAKIGIPHKYMTRLLIHRVVRLNH